MEADDHEENHEKLQIDGTIRNVDEWKLPHDNNKEQSTAERKRFNSYWAQLNWGHRASKESGINWQKTKDDFERKEPTINFAKKDTLNPEAEMIDPSKVSDQMANLKFMRIEKKAKRAAL